MTRTRQYVLAVDPGKTTGLAWWLDGRDPYVEEAEMIPLLSGVETSLMSRRGTLIVCERYVIGPQTLRKSRQTWSLEIIGALRYLAAKWGAEFVLQDAAGAKRLVPDRALKALGWWAVGKEHGRDALRHLAFRLLQDGRLDPAKLIG